MRIVLLVLFSCSLLRADPLADLKAALARLDARDSVKARVEYRYWNSRGDAKKPVIEEGTATARVEAGAEGLRVSWSREQLEAAAAEARTAETDAERRMPIRHAMDALSTNGLNDYLNGTPRLLRTLANAEFLEEKPASWQGQPARLLVCKLTPRLRESERKYVKEIDATARFWVGADGLPLGAETRVRIKGRALLVIGFESTETEEFRFARVGDRLVVMRDVRESSGSGGGEGGQQKTVASLTLGDG